MMTCLRFSSLRQRSYAMLIAAGMAFAVLSTSSAFASDLVERSVIGRWKITAALDAADIASLDDREARQLVGRTLEISEERLEFGERVCASPGFESERVEPALYLREHYRASAAQLSLPNPVIIVHLDCTSAFIKTRNRLVIFWKGWFFDAVRVRR